MLLKRQQTRDGAVSRGAWACLLGIVLTSASGMGHAHVSLEEICTVPEDREGPALNLNPLMLRETVYTVVSEIQRGYDYAFNLCGPMAFVDRLCTEGSGMCARNIEMGKGNEIGESVYGLVNTTRVRRGAMKDTVVYTMNTTSLCASNGRPATVDILLVCDPNGRQVGDIKVVAEDWLNCTVSVAFETAAVCSEPPPPTTPPASIAGFTGWQYDAIVSAIAVGGFLFVYVTMGYVYLGMRGYKGMDRVPIPGCCAPMCREKGEYTEL